MGTPAPAVTVITATYNRSATLRLTLRSLLNQDFADFEAWIVGDACTDDSEAVVASFGDRRLHWHNLARNHGSQAFPNNAGLERARGRSIAYLGHDDLWFPWHLSTLVPFIEATGAALVHPLCALIGPDGRRECVGTPRDGVTYAEHFVPPSAWLHRHDLLDTVGRWRDPDRLRWNVDFDFLRRVYLAGQTIAFCPRLTVLKLPSVWFPGAYRNAGEPPQRAFSEALEAGAAALEHQLLLELAVAFARAHRGGDEPAPAAFWRAFRILLRALRARYLRGRSPFDRILYHRYQRQRRSLRRKRGLPNYELRMSNDE
jgi:glycosyltransferase involved in cell wall biosynthesis